MADITGLLLAAGASQRFGGNKLLAQLGGQALVLYAAKALSVCDKVVAVVRTDDHELHQILRQNGIAVVVNHQAKQGMGRSIAAGVKSCENSAGWCILPADMPAVQAASIQAVADALRGGAALAAPFYHGHRGHPVGFSRCYKDDLLLLTGDLGAREILAAHSDQIVRLNVDDLGILRDIDTPQDLMTSQPAVRANQNS